MAMSPGGGRGALSEINVTPLVDVMLVLLIVFMVTTPIIVSDLAQRKVEVDLPTTNAKPVTEAELNTVLILDADLNVKIDRGQGPSDIAGCKATKAGPYEECLAPLGPFLTHNPAIKEMVKDGSRLFLMADRNIPYGFVVDVMSRVKNAGITNLGMVTNPPGGAPKK